MEELLFFIVILVAIFLLRELHEAHCISRRRSAYIQTHNLTNLHISPISRFLKRLLDVVVSLAVCVSVLPLLYLVLGYIIKRTSPGPIIFRQKRLGMFGKEFYCYKFRSMYAGASDRKATRNDERITPVGRFIRKTHIDEIPQFYNVLKGQMSLVGPRPLRWSEVQKFPDIPQMRARFLLRPGITGLTQIHSGRELPPDKYLAYDLTYVYAQSLTKDVYLMWQTLKFQDVAY